MHCRTSPNSDEIFSLLLKNLRQEEARIKSTESLLDDLTSVTYDETRVRFRIEAAQRLATALQNDREALLGQISEQTGIPVEKLNLTALMSVCPPACRSEFYAAKRGLHRTLHRAHRASGSTAVLVNESLRLRQIVLSALMGISTSDRYDSNGSQPMDSCSTRMESRS